MQGPNIRALRKLGSLFVVLLFWSEVANAQKWDTPTLPVPFNVGVALQLTDGNILVQDFDNSAWWELVPDNVGSYANGIFIPVGAFPPAMHYTPNYFTSAVLPDGRVIVEGGEFNKGVEDWTNKGAIYDPQTFTWTEVKPPKGWTQIGDAQSVVRDDGTFMLANINSEGFATLDAKTLTWTVDAGAGKADINDEEGWTLLPGGDVLTVDAYVFDSSDPSGKNSEIWDSKTDTWSSAGSTVVQLWDSRNGCGGSGSNEVGPAVLRPDGTVFATGANSCPGKAGHTAIYNPKTKKWKKGPDFPNDNDIADGSAAVLPDGNVLVDTNPGYGNNPSTLYEFDGKKFLNIPQPQGNSGNTEGGRMLITPNGSIMFLHISTPDIWFYHPKGTYKAAWQPHITSFPACVAVGGTYTVKGKQFNGLTQGAFFGDDAQSATNYPLVRFKNDATGHIFFARTHDFSTMAVATGTKIVSTQFDILTGTETGPSTVEVIANGIPSKTKKIFLQELCL